MRYLLGSLGWLPIKVLMVPLVLPMQVLVRLGVLMVSLIWGSSSHHRV